MNRTLTSLAALALLVLLAAGCGTESSVDPIQTAQVDLTVSFDWSTNTGTIPDDGTIEANTRPSGDPDSVTIESGLLMLRTVRLHTTPVTPDTNITAADEDRDVSDASVRYQGPYIAQLGTNKLDLGTITVPVGNYEQMTFVMQKARETDDLGDHDDLLGSSVRVAGRVWRDNIGHSFVFETDYTSEVAVDGSFDVKGAGGENLGVVFEVGQWFHNGARWLDPNDPADRSPIIRCMLRNSSGGNAVQ